MDATITRTYATVNDGPSKLNLRITWHYLIALLALMICTGELHEQIHITTGYFICGGYGPRDFNAWQTAESCAMPSLSFLATLAGPLWSYLVMWTGAVLLLTARSTIYRTIGFSLVFAPLPFARIFTAIVGGGDEKVVLRAVTGLTDPLSLKIATAAIVSLICLPPIVIAWRSISNRFALLYPIAFSVLPLVVLGIYVLTLLNKLLSTGFLSSVFILGTPTLILVHFAVMACVLVLCRNWLLEINRNYEPAMSVLK